MRTVSSILSNTVAMSQKTKQLSQKMIYSDLLLYQRTGFQQKTDTWLFISSPLTIKAWFFKHKYQIVDRVTHKN